MDLYVCMETFTASFSVLSGHDGSVCVRVRERDRDCINQRDEGCKVERSHRRLSEVLAQLSFGSERPVQQVRCWSLLKGQHTLKSKLCVAPPPCKWC